MEVIYLISIAAIALLPILQDYRLQKQREKMDEALPIALLELSTLPIHSMKDVAKYLASGYGPLSEVFKRAEKLMERGIPPTSAVIHAARGTTPLVEHAVDMIVAGYRSGANWSEIIRKTAEDIEAVVDMERQRRAGLALQKYNVLLSAAVFVPALLGISARMVEKIGAGGWNPLEQALQSALIPYILILSLESAVFLAVLDGRMRNAIYYAAALAGIGVVSFIVAKGM